MPNKKPYIRLPNRAVVFVGDGSKALFLLNEGNGLKPRLVVQQAFEDENPPTHEQGSDKPGGALSGTEPNRSAMEQTDWHDQEEQRFLQKLLGHLDAAVHAGQTKSLFIVAPPRALGVLRQSYSHELRNALRAEIDKDFVKLPVDEIEQHLKAA